jgi:hypothetical protein
VAEAFLTDPYPDHFNSVIHLNGDRQDCRVQNLARRPRTFAIRYHRQFTPALETEKLKGHHYYLPESDEHFLSVTSVVQKYGLIGVDLFVKTLNGDRVWPGGYRFEFVRD